MEISIIVAVSDNGVIGKDGEIPWFVRGEQARFKTITMGHPIIMGRKTHESIGRTLPGRLNVVISRNRAYKVQEGSVLVGSLEEALSLTEAESAEQVFVIGGESFFNEALPKASRLYLTKVHATVEGDKFFSYNPREWKLISSEFYEKEKVDDRPYDFEVCVLEKIRHSPV